MDRLQCEGCKKWVHRECSGQPNDVFCKLSPTLGINAFRCSVKCELLLMPYSNLDHDDFVKFVSFGKRDFFKNITKNRKKRKTRQLEQMSFSDSNCKYVEPIEIKDIVLDECVNDLTIFHGNVCSLRKNHGKPIETFHNGTKLPDVIGVTETRVIGANK